MIRQTMKTLSIAAMILPVLLMAQNNIGFVQSDRIRAEYEEFKDAEAQLQLEYRL